VNATAFDIRHFSKTSLPVTIFRLNCQTPRIGIPNNYTNLNKAVLIPNKTMSTAIEINSVSVLVCNETVVT
jgi:hypothetical protein